MSTRREFEWDVVLNPRLDMWFEALRADGWYRDINTPGIKTLRSTVVYTFQRLTPELEESARQ